MLLLLLKLYIIFKNKWLVCISFKQISKIFLIFSILNSYFFVVRLSGSCHCTIHLVHYVTNCYLIADIISQERLGILDFIKITLSFKYLKKIVLVL